MAVKSKGLGRGLDTLIPEKKSIKSSQKSETSMSAEKQEPQNGELMMKINMVEPNRDQPRKILKRMHCLNWQTLSNKWGFCSLFL